jgi:hypothetical protein
MHAKGAATKRLGRLLSDGFGVREWGISPSENRRTKLLVLLSRSVEDLWKERYAR